MELSKDRASLRKKWQDSLIVADKIEIVNEVATDSKRIPLLALADAEKWLRYALMVFAISLLAYVVRLTFFCLAMVDSSLCPLPSYHSLSLLQLQESL